MLQDGEKGVVVQRDKTTYAIAPHVPCGIITADKLRQLADVADKYHVQEIKITSASRITLIGIQEEDVDKIWGELGYNPGHTVGLCIRSVKACPGTTFCKRGMQDSQTMGLELDRRYHGIEVPGKMKFGVSGCPNQCAENCIKDISLYGTNKGWRLMVGGNGGGKPRLAQLVTKELSDEKALELFDRCVQYYIEHAGKHQRFGLMLDRKFDDFEDFRKVILGDDYEELK